MTSKFSPKNNFSVSYHAGLRMQEMGLDWPEVRDALIRPELEYPGQPSSAGLPTRVAVSHRLAVVPSADGVVITALWHGAEARHAA